MDPRSKAPVPIATQVRGLAESSDCKTVLDLYQCLVGVVLGDHFDVNNIFPAASNREGENVVSLDVRDKANSATIGSIKLFIIGARIVGHLRLEDGLLISWSRDLAQSIKFDVPIGYQSFREPHKEILDLQTNMVWKAVLHVKSVNGIINLPMLGRMPDNVIYRVFSYLSGSDLREVSFVCRRFKNIAYSDELWRGVCRKHSWFSRLQQKDRYNGAWRAYYRQYRKFRSRRSRLRRELLEAGARGPTQPIMIINRRRGRRGADDHVQPIMVIDRRRHRRHGGAAPHIHLHRPGVRRGAAVAQQGVRRVLRLNPRQNVAAVQQPGWLPPRPDQVNVMAPIQLQMQLQGGPIQMQGGLAVVGQPARDPQQPQGAAEQPPQEPVVVPRLPERNEAPNAPPGAAPNQRARDPERQRQQRRDLAEALGRGRALLAQQRRRIAQELHQQLLQQQFMRRVDDPRHQQLLVVSEEFERTLQSASSLLQWIENNTAPPHQAHQVVADINERLRELQRLAQQFHQQAQRRPAGPAGPEPAAAPAPNLQPQIPGAADNIAQPPAAGDPVGEAEQPGDEIGQPIPVLAPFPEPPPGEDGGEENIAPENDGVGEDGVQVEHDNDEENVRINLMAEPLDNELVDGDPANALLQAVRMEDGNVHINAGGLNIAIELPNRDQEMEPERNDQPPGIRNRISHRNENSPFFGLDPRNIQIMRARIAIIGGEFVKRIKCNLSGEFPPNHNFLTSELVYMSNVIVKDIRQSLQIPSDQPDPLTPPRPLPEFYPYFDPEMPDQEILERRVNTIAEIFNETIRSALRHDKVHIDKQVRRFQRNTRDNNADPASDDMSFASQYFHLKIRELVSSAALQLDNVVVCEGGESTHRLTHRVLSVALGRAYEDVNRRSGTLGFGREPEPRQRINVPVTLSPDQGGDHVTHDEQPGSSKDYEAVPSKSEQSTSVSDRKKRRLSAETAAGSCNVKIAKFDS